MSALTLIKEHLIFITRQNKEKVQMFKKSVEKRASEQLGKQCKLNLCQIDSIAFEHLCSSSKHFIAQTQYLEQG